MCGRDSQGHANMRASISKLLKRAPRDAHHSPCALNAVCCHLVSESLYTIEYDTRTIDRSGANIHGSLAWIVLVVSRIWALMKVSPKARHSRLWRMRVLGGGEAEDGG
eukprot:3152143-Pleurochrysis_carterae.AAC.1